MICFAAWAGETADQTIRLLLSPYEWGIVALCIKAGQLVVEGELGCGGWELGGRPLPSKPFLLSMNTNMSDYG